LIGSGSIVLNRARIESGSAVGRGRARHRRLGGGDGGDRAGRPGARAAGPEDLAKWVGEAVEIYLAGAKRYRTELRRIG